VKQSLNSNQQSTISNKQTYNHKLVEKQILSWKLSKIVRVSIHCQSLLSPRQARTQCSLHTTHSLPITTGSGQTTRLYSSSYLCISKLPTIRFDLRKSHHRVTQTHITHSTRISYPVRATLHLN